MYEDNINREKNQEKPPKRKFWQNLLIMDSSDLKRLLSLSSLMLSFAVLFVYAAAYLLLMPLLDRLVGQGPVLLATLIEAIIPAIIGTMAVMVTWPVFRDKRVLPAAYIWLTLFALLVLIIVLINLRGDLAAGKAFLYFFAWEVLPALIIGNLAVWRRYRAFLFQ